MRYSNEQKHQLVMRYKMRESIADICTQMGIARSTFYSWLKLYQKVRVKENSVLTPHDFLFLKRKIKKLEEIVQVLKQADCTVSSPQKEKLKALEKLYGQFSVHTLCDALEVPRGIF